MHRWLRAMLPAMALGASGALAAQESPPSPEVPPLTLEEVVDAVLRQYPLVEEARQAFAEAEAQVLGTRGGFDPRLSGRINAFPVGPYDGTRVDVNFEQPTRLWGTNFFATWRREDPDVPQFVRYYETNELGSLRAGARIPLWRNGPIDRARANIAQAQLGSSAARFGFEQARLDFVRAASLRYWDWVAAGRRLEIARDLLWIARERDEALRERVARGDIAEFERIDNQRAVVERQGQVIAAERLLENTAILLSLYLRDGEGRPVVPGPSRLPSFPQPRPPEAMLTTSQLEEVIARRPDVAQLVLLRQQQEVERRWARNQQAPALDLTLGASSQYGAGPAQRLEPVLETGLSLGIPIRNRAAIGQEQAAAAVAAQVEARLALQRDRVVTEVLDTLSAVRAAYERVAVVREEVSLARWLEEAERTRFRLGDSTLLFVNLREQAAAEARVREADALAEYHRARASFRAVLAHPLGAVNGLE